MQLSEGGKVKDCFPFKAFFGDVEDLFPDVSVCTSSDPKPASAGDDACDAGTGVDAISTTTMANAKTGAEEIGEDEELKRETSSETPDPKTTDTSSAESEDKPSTSPATTVLASTAAPATGDSNEEPAVSDTESNIQQLNEVKSEDYQHGIIADGCYRYIKSIFTELEVCE